MRRLDTVSSQEELLLAELLTVLETSLKRKFLSEIFFNSLDRVSISYAKKADIKKYAKRVKK